MAVFLESMMFQVHAYWSTCLYLERISCNSKKDHEFLRSEYAASTSANWWHHKCICCSSSWLWTVKSELGYCISLGTSITNSLNTRIPKPDEQKPMEVSSHQLAFNSAGGNLPQCVEQSTWSRSIQVLGKINHSGNIKTLPNDQCSELTLGAVDR